MLAREPPAGPSPSLPRAVARRSRAISSARPAARTLGLVIALFVGITAALLYLTSAQMEILSAVRAYVGGEGLWSKAQKDAVQHLLRYAHTRDDADYARYQDAVGVTLGDRQARIELEKPTPDLAVVAAGFRRGRNHPDDIGGLVMLFRRFRHASYVDEAIRVWTIADGEIARLDHLARAVRARMRSGRSPATPRILPKIDRINERVTPLEDRFSMALAEGARAIKTISIRITFGVALLLLSMGAVVSWMLLARIREWGDKYRHLLDAASDAIVVTDLDTGVILDANRSAEKLTGRTAAELIGMPQELLHAEAERARYREVFLAHAGRGVTTAVDLHVARPDGTRVPVEIRAATTSMGGTRVVQSICRDVTERRLADAELARSRRALEEEARVAGALARVGQQMISSLDTPVLFERLCQLAADLLDGTGSATLLRGADGQGWGAVAVHAARAEDRERLRRTARGFALDPDRFAIVRDEVLELPGGELVMAIHRDADLIGVQVVTRPPDGQGLTPERARIARGLAHVAGIGLENARLVAELEQASRLKSEFVSTMSHELRTPLNVILGYAEMGRDRSIGLDLDDTLSRIEASGRDLLGLIESTLEIGKIEAGRDQVRVEMVPLPAFWAQLGDGCGRLPRKPGVAFDWAKSVPDVVLRTDPRKLVVVVRNLVGNALKFTEQGAVRVTLEATPQGLALRVADTGIGIAPADQQAVFEMFRQVDGSDTRRFGGTGLGLYIVRRFVEQLGGTIVVESALGAGTTFLVTLPAGAVLGRAAAA
ncbi:MAG: PAS domain S-box protein [bacterium]|nr:PAS domain S-box protein [bacterium]